jgi:hypothetical protein
MIFKQDDESKFIFANFNLCKANVHGGFNTVIAFGSKAAESFIQGILEVARTGLITLVVGRIR